MFSGNINIINTISIIVSVLLYVPILSHAKMCPENSMPDEVKAVYIKFKVTDEKYIKLNKKWGAPSSVVGDELEELIVWKNHQWRRLYGKYWGVDSEKEEKYQNEYTKKMDDLIQRQLQGEEIDLEIGEKLTIEMMNREPEHMIFEYDRITVKAPNYTLHYNSSNKTGYGYNTINNPGAKRKNMDKTGRDQLDAWLSNNFKDTNAMFGFKKIASRKSRILGHDVECETIKTNFKDFQREYDQIEICKTNMAGIEINLYEKMGSDGDQYITQAVEINTAYPVKKDQFCAPDYVKINAP